MARVDRVGGRTSAPPNHQNTQLVVRGRGRLRRQGADGSVDVLIADTLPKSEQEGTTHQRIMPFLKERGQVKPFPSVWGGVVVCEPARQRGAGVNAGEATRRARR